MNCTVVMAVYNSRADWLLESVNSVARETDVILADDGSEAEQTRRLLRHFEYHPKVSNVLVTYLPHRGMEPTLNDAIAMVQTDFVAILDSDDRRIRGSLVQQCALLEMWPDVAAVHGRFNYINETGDVILPNVIHPTPCHSSLVFRKSAWEAVGGYPTGFEFGEGDSHFIGRLAGIGKVEPVGILCAERRVHPDSLSFQKQPRLQRIYREANEKSE